MAFAQAASSLLREGREAVFLVYGPDEGDLPELLAYLEAEGLAGIRYEGAIKPGSAPSVLRGAAAYVLPSFGEVVPMTILESMAVGTPVVLTTDCAMADSLSAANAAMVTDGTAAAIASSIAALLDDPEMASMMAGRATRLLNESYSVEAVAQRLENVYSAANSS
jgi:glycosyltransferase involved in cell wall biosynthesis